MELRTTALALAGLALISCAAPRPRARTSSAVGKPFALTAPDLEGREVDVGAATGSVRVVDFWATWCEPCKDAMPVLDRMARELGPAGVRVYGVSIDESRAPIAAFLRARPVTFPILWDEGAVRLSRLDVSFMPVTVIVDRRGTIRYVHQGWDPSRAAEERREVEALLKE
jgi:thiol-disulfide isomerase/thioredoxin